MIANTRNLLGFKSGTAVQMPGLAQPAIQQGEYVAEVIRRRTTGKAGPEPFWYWDKGDLAVVGHTFAVADLRFWKSAGLIAWLLWAGLYLFSYWFYESVLCHAAVGGAVCHQAPRSRGGGRRKHRSLTRRWGRLDKEEKNAGAKEPA